MDEKLAYVCGWIASDGHIGIYPKDKYIGFCLHVKDEYILQKFSEWYGGKVHNYTYKKQLVSGIVDSTTSHLKMYNKDLFNYCIDNDIKNKIIPDDEFKAAYIRGFLEGDGNISIRKTGNYSIGFYNTNKELLNGITEHFQKIFGIEQKLGKRDKFGRYQISYEARIARILIWYLYRNAEHFLPRKAMIANQLLSGESDPIRQYFKVLLVKPTTYILHDNGFVFRLYNCNDSLRSAKMACAGFKMLGINATPKPYGAGKNKAFGIYIPDIRILTYTQDILIPVDKFPGKIKMKA